MNNPYFTTGYEIGFDGKPVTGTGSDGFSRDITEDYLTDGMGVSEEDASAIMDDIFSNGSSVSDAKSYGDLKGKSIEEQYEWLINNDPENATSWMEKFLDYQSAQQSTHDAWSYSKWLEDTQVQRARKDLEAAGINPILAYNYMSGSSGNVGTAQLPSANVATTQTSRRNAELSAGTTDRRTAAVIAGIIGTLVGVILKAVL